MLCRSISCMAAGTLAAIGLDLMAILAVPASSPTPGLVLVMAGSIALAGLLWLADEIADGSQICTAVALPLPQRPALIYRLSAKPFISLSFPRPAQLVLNQIIAKSMVCQWSPLGQPVPRRSTPRRGAL
jgi:hypothetical protein